MNNLLYLLFFVTLILAALIVAWLSSKEKDPVGRAITKYIAASNISLMLYVIASFAPGETAASFFFSLFFCANTIVNYSLFMFANAYNQRKPPKWFMNIVWIVMGADMLSLMLNIVFRHAAVIKRNSAYGFDGWVFSHEIPFYFHMLLCYLFALAFLGYLITRTVKSPRIYKRKYLFIFLFAITGLCMNLVFLKRHFAFDFVIIWYVVLGIMLYFFIYIYLPRDLGLKMGKLYTGKTNSSIIIYDMDGGCIFYNPGACKFCGGKPAQNRFADIMNKFDIDTGNPGCKQTRVLYEEKKRYYEIEYQMILDKKGRFEGSYVVIDDVTAEQEDIEKRIYQVSHDAMTDLLNTTGFYDAVEGMLKLHPKNEFSIIMSNIRQFKIVNDVMGREVGDEFLKEVAAALKDLSYPDVVTGRLQRDIFVVLAPSDHGVEKELQRNIEHRFDEIKKKYQMALSVVNTYGVYPITEREISVEDMCDRANMAINTLKDGEQNGIAYYDKRIKEQMIWESELLGEVEYALEKEEFVVYYQPQVDSLTEQIVGAEALVRWQHPRHGLLAPGKFVPLLERKGKILKLDQYVWEHTVRDLKKLRSEGHDISLSVNISPKDIFAGDIRQFFSALVEKYSVPTEALRLEITETAITLDMRKFVNVISNLQNEGFTMEMDDFGSGYSSLNTLKDIPIDVLKMDMRFLDDATDPQKSRKIMNTIVNLAKDLEVPLIAEGVERKDQVDFLASIGCRNLQGFYYSKPIPYEKFREFLLEHETGGLC